MAGYNWDVFISYRRAGKSQPWVADFFLPTLRDALVEHLGYIPQIFWDNQGTEEGSRWKDTILGALQTSKCIIPIWNKPYFGSTWCVAEWQTFEERAKKADRQVKGLAVPIRFMDGRHTLDDVTETFLLALAGAILFGYGFYALRRPSPVLDLRLFRGRTADQITANRDHALTAFRPKRCDDVGRARSPIEAAAS